MFSLNEKVIYPGYGVATISRLIQKVIGGNVACFFELKFVNKDMTILIPTDNTESIGIRALSSNEYIDQVFLSLTKAPCKIMRDPVTINWNKRNKEYQSRIRGGNFKEIGEIYRDLRLISLNKTLSFGEKNLLNQTEMLLAEEIAIVKCINDQNAIVFLREFFVDSSSSIDMNISTITHQKSSSTLTML